LDHTDFANAVLNGAIIRGASFKKALNLTQEQINRCVGDAATVLPDYIERPASSSSKPVQATTETTTPETDYDAVGELVISRRVKTIGVGLVLVSLAAFVWNFFPVHETVPSPSPTTATTIDITPDVPSLRTVTPAASEVTAPITSDAPPSKTASPGASEIFQNCQTDHGKDETDGRHRVLLSSMLLPIVYSLDLWNSNDEDSSIRKEGTFAQFWRDYLRDHAQAGTRVLHFLGTGFGVAALILGIVGVDPMIAILGMMGGYAFAWSGEPASDTQSPYVEPVAAQDAKRGKLLHALTNWRRGWDSNPRYGYPYNGFRVLRFSCRRVSPCN
jgi:hypothetical protein